MSEKVTVSVPVWTVVAMGTLTILMGVTTLVALRLAQAEYGQRTGWYEERVNAADVFPEWGQPVISGCEIAFQEMSAAEYPTIAEIQWFNHNCPQSRETPNAPAYPEGLAADRSWWPQDTTRLDSP